MEEHNITYTLTLKKTLSLIPKDNVIPSHSYYGLHTHIYEYIYKNTEDAW